MGNAPVIPHKQLAILSSPQNWRFVCSALPVEERPVRNASYARWVSRHLDRHARREILFCIAGRTIEHFAGQDYPCQPGSVFLFDTNEVHACGYPEDGKSFIHLWIAVLATDVIANVYCQRGRNAAEQRHAPMVLAQAERDLLLRCWQLAGHPSPWMSPAIRRTALSAAVYAIVLRAMDHWLTQTENDDSIRLRQKIVEAVQRHIETHLNEAGDLDALAHLAGYSKFHFTRIFKACTGRTVHAFTDGCRVARARSMLKEGFLCKEIARVLGFSSPAAFSNWRHRHRF